MLLCYVCGCTFTCVFLLHVIVLCVFVLYAHNSVCVCVSVCLCVHLCVVV